MESYLREIVQLSLGSTPEEMLRASLQSCIELSGAKGGSILGEEGPHLQFLFSNVPELIGVRVPFDSIAGVTVNKGLVVYTYAPADSRHFTGVDDSIRQLTRYLLSIPIPSVHKSAGSAALTRNAGALQLLFDTNIFPDVDVKAGPREFEVSAFKESELYERCLKNIFWLLPIVAFGIEVMRLRQTSYQAIHELKNKMIAALSWIDYLKEDIGKQNAALMEEGSIKEDFDLSASSIREGAELAKNYLQFTKIYTPAFAPADINEVLKQTAASAQAFAREIGMPGLKVATEFDQSVGVRDLDTGQLKMAFFNLCKNAVEALASHRVANPAIKLSSLRKDGRMEVTISDNGPGMPREIADNLFIPFKTKKEGGTGLGLTITKKIIDVHGGTISCQTGKDGTRFIIVI